MKELEPDMVNSPAHYNFAGIECVDAIRAATGSRKHPKVFVAIQI